MKCPRCGNEVSQQEAYCGQCGAPNTPQPKLTRMLNTPPPHSGRLASYHPNAPIEPAEAHKTRQPPPAQASNIASPADGSFVSRHNSARLPGPNHQTPFYHDATEAISISPDPTNQGYAPGYQPQSVYPMDQLSPSMPAFLPGKYAAPAQPQRLFVAGQGYGPGGHGHLFPPQQEQQNSAVIIVICICLVIALISGIAVITLLVARNQQPSSPTIATASPIATTQHSTPTSASSPTPTPTAAASPTPTVLPTPPPDAGFAWCADACTPFGFTLEYPAGWQAGPSTSSAGIQFINPTQGDEYASFKAPGPTGGSAGDLLAADLQANYASKPGYTPPTSTSTATISGETWVAAIAYYQTDTQKERVVVYATVHQGKTYLIELQAPDSQFDVVYGQFFNPMLGKYQFLQATT